MTVKEKARQRAVLTIAYNDYERGLNRYSFYKVRDRAVSEDLVHDTFIKTWSYLVKGGDIVMMKSFLYHILNNLIVDEYRKRKTISLDVLLEKGIEPGVDSFDRMIDIFDGKTALLLVQKLPEKYKHVIYMRYAQDMSLKEISIITGQSTKTIAVQAHRGLAKLKELYDLE